MIHFIVELYYKKNLIPFWSRYWDETLSNYNYDFVSIPNF